MRHGKKINHLGRKSSHRKALLSNMASSLILHKRISTTVAKAKALRTYIEPLLTKAKEDTTHSRRVVFSYLQNKESVTVLFRDVASKIADRPGGYTRILKTGTRLGDNAEMCFIELVDYNELMLKDKAPAKAKASSTRRGGKKKADTPVAAAPAKPTAPKAEAKAETAEPAAPKAEAKAETAAEPAAEASKAPETPETPEAGDESSSEEPKEE
jgi:large subunit ribosomal protein L17